MHHPLAVAALIRCSPLLDFIGIDYTFCMPLRSRLVFVLCVLTAVGSPALAQLPLTTQEQVDACVRVLRQGINPQRGDIDLAVLGSLRELGDPSLKPLWFQLAQQERWEAQVHAILALSELTPDNPADAWMISQLRSPDAQRAVVATLLDRDALTPEHSRRLLGSEVLEPVTELWLLADLTSHGETVDAARLRTIAGSEDLDLAGLAACLLAHQGDHSLLNQNVEKIAALPREQRDRHLMEQFIAIEQYQLTGALDWVMRMVDEMEIDRQVKWQAVRVFLTLAPERGVPMWKRRAAEITSDGEWVRAVLLLLDAGSSVPADTYRLVPRENELLLAMAQLGEAISNNQSLAQPLMVLIDLGHVGTARWALGRVEKLTPEEARSVYLHVIEQMESMRAGRDDRAEMAVAATEMLYKIDPDAALDHLESVPDDSTTQEIMLLGLMRCKGEAIGDTAKKIRRIGHSRADSITLILTAKHAEKLNDADLKQLGIIAGGGGQLAAALRAQAAWLYLKHAEKVEQALNRIFAKS
jgi:hypothetical protein